LKTNKLVEEVEQYRNICKKDLDAAMPLVEAALASLNSLRKQDIQELKSFTNPSAEVVNVTAAVMILTASEEKGVPKNTSWNECKKMMANPQQFLQSLLNFDKEHIPKANIDAIQKYLNDPKFNKDVVLSKSVAAAGLCSWVINIVGYYDIHCRVEPMRIKLREAELKLEQSRNALHKIQNKVKELQNR